MKKITNNKKTICLNMIVKNEAHIILESLNNIYKYIDYWVISDTGSTDQTVDIIKKFFIEKNIPGEIVYHEWKNFGHNRSMALLAAYKKSDYIFIMDADDITVGNIVFPQVMNADAYNVDFGSSFTYKRMIILNNNLIWEYLGVLHEYVSCKNKLNLKIEYIGNSFYIQSRRLGDRSKDKQKYLKDAEILVNAIEKNEDINLIPRYCFYAGQSYKDYNDHENSIKYYKKRIEYGGWVEELFISYMEIGNAMIKLRPKYSIDQIVDTFMSGYKILPKRVECLFYLANFYYNINMLEDAFKIASIGSIIKYPSNCILFIYKSIYDYGVKELLFKILLKIQINNITIKNFTIEKITEKLNDITGTMLCDNIVPDNIKHSIVKMLKLPINTLIFDDYDFYQSNDSVGNDIVYLPNKTIKELKEYCDNNIQSVGFNTFGYIKSFITTPDKFIYLHNQNYNYDGIYVKKNLYLSENYDFYNKEKVMEINSHIKNNTNLNNLITLTITSCKRIDLFKRTINSFINCCVDILSINRFICIDDNSSEEDRNSMKELYPFFEFIFKDETTRGHIHSMNMIIDLVTTEYLLHLEDDWLFLQKYDYITKALEILNQKTIIQIDTIPSCQNINNKKICQVLFNKNYIEINNLQVLGGYLCETNNKNKYVIHEYYDKNDDTKYNEAVNKYKGTTCIYWPHYSFRPSVIKTEIFKKIGKYNKFASFFEMEYAYRYVQNNYISCFFNMNPCKHIGKLTFETNEKNPNAYSLNKIDQFNKSLLENNFIYEDYDFYPNLDSFGNDIIKMDNRDLHKIKLNADLLDNCVGFNTFGYLKHKINPISSFIKLPNSYYKNDGIYIKKSNKSNWQIICVNLEKRIDRKNKIIELFNQNNITNYKFYNAIDGKSLEPSIEIYNLFKNNDFNYRKNVIGCALSHYNLWTELVKSDSNYYFITEDDITLTSNFNTKFDLIIKNINDNKDLYDIVFLGYSMYTENKTKFANKYYNHNVNDIILTKCDIDLYIGGFYSYIITKAGAIKMLDYIKQNGIKHGIDYLIKLNTNLNILETNPFLVYSDWVQTITSTVDSDIQKDFEPFDFTAVLNEQINSKWSYIKGMDFPGNDLKFVGKIKITELYKIAENTIGCNAFNTLGFLKHNVDFNIVKINKIRVLVNCLFLISYIFFLNIDINNDLQF